MLGIGGGELAGLLVIGLLVLGPERLPRYAADLARLIRTVRAMADKAREDVRSSLGPELRDLGVAKDDLASWFGDEEDDAVRRAPRKRQAETATPPTYPDAT